MSTRTPLRRETREWTDPKFRPITAAFWPQVRQMAGRGGVGVRVLNDTSGAPARYVPMSEEIDIQKKLIAHLDPKDVADPKFAKTHPSLYGAVVHETCHAAQSRMGLEAIHKRFGARHYATFSLLEEGRCETQNQSNLNAIQKAALKACVLEIVLRDLDVKDDEGHPLDEKRVAIQLLGLIAGRMHNGIVPSSHEMVERLVRIASKTLGPDYYARFYRLGVEFAAIPWSVYSNVEEQMHDIVKQWMAVEDELFPPEDDEDEEKQPGGKGKGKSGEDEEEQEGSGSGKGEDEGEEESEGEGNGGSSTKGPGNEDLSRDGELKDTEQEGANDKNKHEVIEHQGDAATGLVDNGSFETEENENIAEIVEALTEAVEQIKDETVQGEIGPAVRVRYHATQQDNEERRRLNAKYRKAWRD